ncbi:MAG TPA: hypothetical protein VLN56_07305 [Gammaproteobacteria bacterium]|nr:hypothetical protein [Gammaproteobacteria bacterium]
MGDWDSETTNRILEEIRNNQKLQLERQAESLDMQRQQLSLVEKQMERAGKIQDRAEELQERGSRIMTLARRTLFLEPVSRFRTVTRNLETGSSQPRPRVFVSRLPVPCLSPERRV